ncbi:MAG: DUF938 domain-containing protein [Pseudomonadota bacterium]
MAFCFLSPHNRLVDLPFSQAAANNSEPILGQLRSLLADRRRVLEIGAGTGQHAVHFAAALPHLEWQPTDHQDALATLGPRCKAAQLSNVLAPKALDIASGPWPSPWPDAVYTANTLHIVATDLVEALIVACGERAKIGSLLIAYGPFNCGGSYTSESNECFDQWLKDRDPRSGIRDQEWVDGLANEAGYAPKTDVAMPANNRLLVWEKR